MIIFPSRLYFLPFAFLFFFSLICSSQARNPEERIINSAKHSVVDKVSMEIEGMEFSQKKDITWEEFYSDINVLCDKIKHSGRKFTGVIVFDVNSLVPASIIMAKLQINKVEIVDFHVNSEEAGKSFIANSLQHNIGANEGDNLLVIENIIVRGLNAKRIFPHAAVATVYLKGEEKSEEIDFFSKQLTNRNEFLSFPWEHDKHSSR